MQKLIEKGAFYSPNLTALAPEALKHPMHQDPEFPPTKKFMWLRNNSDQLIPLIKKYKPKLVFDSDYILLTGVPYRQAIDFTKFNMAREFGNFWALKSMTSTGGELAALTGPENPYPDGKLGVIEKGAYADILIVDTQQIVYYNQGHIEGAVSVPLSEIALREWQPSPGQEVILYCD